MVYKKYIRRNGKIFGPYLYESHRENGRVINRYVGSEEISSERKSSSFNFCKSELLVGGILVLSLVVLLLIFSNVVHTGKVSLSIEPSYSAGEIIQGEINFELSSGEFIPADSSVILQLNDVSEKIELSELVSNSVSSGDFSAEGVSLSGSGEGYGGNESMDLEIDISKFNIGAEEGMLSAKLVYGDVEIASSSEDIIIEEEIVVENATNLSEEGIVVENATNLSDEVESFDSETVFNDSNALDSLALDKGSLVSTLASSPLIHFAGFESGVQGWAFSGVDSDRSATMSKVTDSGDQGGTFSAHLQDDTADSSFEQSFNFTGYNLINLSFYFFPTSVEAGEFVQVFCGSSEIFRWTDGDLGEETWVFTSRIIYPANCTFTSSVEIRFEGNPGLSADNDDFYVDGINISGINLPPPVQDNSPTVSLVSPANGNVTSSNSINFTCNATDDNALRNITFYWNYSGSFVANGTVSVNGKFNQSSFFRANLSNGAISWNCRACDNASQCNFAAANRTVTITCILNLTNTSWSGWMNLSCSGTQMNQSRNRTQYDSSNCGEIANRTFFDYQLAGPTYANATETNWVNISCLPDNTMNQTRNLTQYDAYACAANTTLFEYRATESCDFCTPNMTNTTESAWTNKGDCKTDDLQLQNRSWIEYDTKNCGEIENVTHLEYKNITCNYCSEYITGPFNTTCLPSNTLTQYYVDMSYGSCCALTGIVSDCSINNNPSYANQTFACQYDTIPPSFNSGNTMPQPGSQYNQSQSILIVANPSENSSVFAIISWDATSEAVNLTYNGTQWFYTTSFANTNLPGNYTIVINATDNAGNSNVTTTNFVVNDATAPLIGSITPSAGTGYNPSVNVNIAANVTDLYYDSVSSVIAQITYPDGTSVNYALIEIDNTQIFDYLSFSDTNATGRYNITIIANDSSGNVNISRSWFNITSEDVTAPVITESNIEPYDSAIGTNVSLNASASDNVAISGIFANITLPNETVIVLEMPADYVIQIAGRHNVTFWANDTSGNIAIFDDYFIAPGNYYNITFNIVNSNLSGIPVNLTIYFADTDKVVHMHEFNGSALDTHGDILYDLYYETIDEGANIRLNGVNLSIYTNDTLGVDRNYTISGYLLVYGINSTYGFSSAVVEINYGGAGYTNESSLVLEKCDDWDFVNWNCLGSWNDITSQSQQDLIGQTFTTNVTSFSGFGIRDTTITPPSQPSGGGGGGHIYPAPAAGEADLALDNDLIEVKLLQDERTTRRLILTSRDNRTFNMTLRVEGLDGMINIAESRFRLDAGAMKEINLEFYASANQKPGVYTGRIIIDSGFGEKIVNVIIEIKERSPLLDVIVKLVPGFKRVCPGTTANSVVTLRNIGLQKEFELTLVLSVRDLNKNLIFEVSRETIKMNESIVNISREFVVPKYFADGKYMLLAQADYDNFQAESYEIFEVVRKTKTSICEILALLALLAGFIWLIFLLFRKKHRERVLKIEQLVQVKVTCPLSAGYKLPKSKPALMHKLYMFFARAGKAFDGFAYSFVEGMRKTFAAVSAGINGLLEGIVEFMRFLIHGTKRLLIKLARAFEVLISGAVEFLRYLIYGAVMFFRTLLYGIESNAESFAHGVKLAERRSVRNAVNAEQGAVSDFKEIFDRLSKGVMDFAYFLIYGFRMFLISIGSFIVGLFFGMAGFAGFLVKGVQRLFFGFSRFAVGLVFGAVEFFGYLVYSLGKFSNSLIYGADQEVELFVHKVKLAKRRSLRKGNELENTVMSYIERWFARVLESLESKTERGNVPEEISAEQKDIYVLNAEKNILRNEIKNLDAEFKRGTLDSKGYLKTREKLGKELWDIKHRM